MYINKCVNSKRRIVLTNSVHAYIQEYLKGSENHMDAGDASTFLK